MTTLLTLLDRQPDDTETKEVFRYYKKVYDDNGRFLDKAQCGFCQKSHTYRGSDSDSTLWRHLRRIHNVQRSNVDPLSTTGPAKIVVKTPKTKSKSDTTKCKSDTPVCIEVDYKQNPIYRYFTVYMNNQAKCRVCSSASLPTPSLLAHSTALKNHLETHPRAYKLYELEKEFGEAGPEYNENVHRPKSEGASVFMLDVDGTYTCKICGKITTGEADELLNHFKEEHPSLIAQVAGTEGVISEVVKLGGKKKKNPIPILSHKPKPIKRKDTVQVSAESDTRSLNELSLKDDLDTFSLYISSLLRNMPKDDCAKIQHTIINNIFQAKLNATSEKSEHESIQDKECPEDECTKTKLNSEGVKSYKRVIIEANQNMESENMDDDVTDIEDESTEQIEGIEEEPPAFKRYKYAITEEAEILELT